MAGKGGTTPGAGRKPLPPEQRKVQFTAIVLPDTYAVLRAMRATPTEGLGAVIDRLVAGREQE